MKRHIIIIAMALVAMAASAVVKPGIEVLRDGGFKRRLG